MKRLVRYIGCVAADTIRDMLALTWSIIYNVVTLVISIKPFGEISLTDFPVMLCIIVAQIIYLVLYPTIRIKQAIDDYRHR